MEKSVYKWAMQSIASLKKVQMVDICRYAKLVSTNKLFLGSSGWCANFLNRHPDLKKIIKRRAPAIRKQKKKYFKGPINEYEMG